MRIEWTHPALADLRCIQGYIAKDSTYYARQFIERIFNAVEDICDFPRAGRCVPEMSSENIRELIFQGYRIIYCLEQETIYILAVVHGSRDLTKLKVLPR